MTCPECGAQMTHGKRWDHMSVHGRECAFQVTGWWCDACGEAVFDGDALATAEGAWRKLTACTPIEREGSV